MLKTILSISGRPGLYKLISQGRGTLIVETIDETKKRFPVYAKEKVSSLADIGMYTENDEEPLYKVLDAMKKKEEGKTVDMDLRKATGDVLKNYLAEVLPDYDRDRVRVSDIKKLIQWYNLLVANGITDFQEEADEASDRQSASEAE